MFDVQYYPDANCLTITVAGFWTIETVVELAKAVGSMGREAQAIRDDFNVVVESFAFPVQAHDVADLLANIMRGGMTLTSGRTAVLVGSQLNKAQVERTLIHPRVRAFLTREAAQDWLAGVG